MKEVLQRFRNAGLKLKSSKCHFFRKEVKFLGYLVSGEGIHIHPDLMEKIVTWPVFTNLTELRGFLGLGSYNRCWIPWFSQKMLPLIRLMKKDVPFKWTRECQEAFEKLKEEILSDNLMAHPTDLGEYILDCDASCDSLGCTLTLVQNGKE